MSSESRFLLIPPYTTCTQAPCVPKTHAGVDMSDPRSSTTNAATPGGPRRNERWGNRESGRGGARAKNHAHIRTKHEKVQVRRHTFSFSLGKNLQKVCTSGVTCHSRTSGSYGRSWKEKAQENDERE